MPIYKKIISSVIDLSRIFCFTFHSVFYLYLTLDTLLPSPSWIVSMGAAMIMAGCILWPWMEMNWQHFHHIFDLTKLTLIFLLGTNQLIGNVNWHELFLLQPPDALTGAKLCFNARVIPDLAKYLPNDGSDFHDNSQLINSSPTHFFLFAIHVVTTVLTSFRMRKLSILLRFSNCLRSNAAQMRNSHFVALGNPLTPASNEAIANWLNRKDSEGIINFDVLKIKERRLQINLSFLWGSTLIMFRKWSVA